MPIEFGKFKGRDLSDPEIPTSYLEWLYGEMVTTAEGIQAELVRREQVEEDNVTLAEHIINSGFRVATSQYEGDKEALRALTGAHTALQEILVRYFKEGRKIEETRRMNQTRDARSARNRRDAENILKDKHADADDVLWAKKILNGH
jgi:hypothetical protein